MAATAVQLLNPDDTFQKIYKLYQTLNKKVLKCNFREFVPYCPTWTVEYDINIQINIGAVDQKDYFKPIEPKKKPKKKKLKGPERKNHLVKRVANEVQLYQPIGPMALPSPPPPLHPPIDWFLLLYVLYFMALKNGIENLSATLEKAETKVNEQLDQASYNLNEDVLKKLQATKEDIGIFLETIQGITHQVGLFPTQLNQLNDCIRRLQETFDDLDEAKIPEVLKTTIQPTHEQYITALLGLDENVANFLHENNYYSDEQWIMEYFSSR